MSSYDAFEEVLVAYLQWPLWALRLNMSLVVLVISTSLFQQMQGPVSSKSSTEINKKAATIEFRMFQLQYLTVYLITMLADWLQGTHMYTLYTSYGMQVGTLFLTGFASSALFGTFLGIYVDKWGRKFGCLIFCALEIVINTLEHYPNMRVLLIGRVLGGLSTTLLFTAFESWMVSEHRRRGFDESLLADTFSIASAGNGLMAISAGYLAQLAADMNGDIGPFQLAIALTVLTMGFLFFWNENYGDSHTPKADNESKNGDSSDNKVEPTFFESLYIIVKQPPIVMLGLGQACFEGAIYTFVFLWVPSLMTLHEGQLHTGLIFSTFMLAMTFGGMLFALVLPIFPGGAEGLCCMVFFLAAGAMAMPVYWFEFWPVLISFLVLECMVGMFNSCGATLRSKYYPEQLQSSVTSVFRLPLNMLVVVGTLLSDAAKTSSDLQVVFTIIAVVLLGASMLQMGLCMITSRQ